MFISHQLTKPITLCTVQAITKSSLQFKSLIRAKSTLTRLRNVGTLQNFSIKGFKNDRILGYCDFCPPYLLKPSRSFNSTPLRLNKYGDKGSGSKVEFMSEGTRSTLYYIGAVGVLAFGLSYAAVPLYRIFCQAYSYGGTTQDGHDFEKVESMEKVNERTIRVRFNADTAASMTWNFRPQQSEIRVHPGETALAFYTAKNPTDRPVIGVSTYNVVPFDAGQYFNKIQCFCFEEQMLNPHEKVDMPVFFYIDPEFADDPKMQNIDMITLSYTFFEAREGLQLPMPQFSR